MPDVDYLRQAMHAETSDLPLYLPLDRIRRRAHVLRTWRIASMAAGFTSFVAVLAVPGYVLVDQAGPTGGDLIGVPPSASPSACPMPGELPGVLGSAVDTDASIEGPDGTRYDVVIALTSPPDTPVFNIAFRDRATGRLESWDQTVLVPAPGGGFLGREATWQFLSSQLPLGAGRVLDIGVYAGAAHRITVASDGNSSDAHIALNEPTGWTLFWVERTATALPPDANVGPEEYEGPGRLTITAYDSTGRIQDTVTGGFRVGNNVQNPRDDAPDPDDTPTPDLTPTPSLPAPDPTPPAVCPAFS